MSTVTGGRVLAQMLSEYGIDHVFGLGGAHTGPFYQGLYEFRDSIKHVLVRDEKCGAFAADAYSRVAYKPGICDAQAGPGAANLVPGVAEAFTNSIPLIAITGNVVSSIFGKGQSQELDQVGLLRPVCKAVFHVNETSRIPTTVRAAFRLATSGRPGPVLIDLPMDVSGASRDFGSDVYIETDCCSYPSRRVEPEQASIIQASKLLQQAERPTILAGGGAMLSQAWNEIIDLAELIPAPVATTITGKGIIPENHPLSVGPIGRQGFRPAANKALEEADVVLAIGTKFHYTATDDWKLPSSNAKLIHIDVDPGEIGRVYPTTIGIAADAKLAAASLAKHLRTSAAKGRKTPWTQRLQSMAKEWASSTEADMGSLNGPVRRKFAIKIIRKILAPNDILVTDTSQTGAYTSTYFDILATGRTFIEPRGTAPIGGALPGAIGAKCAALKRNVVAIGGDGGFAYHPSELETAKRIGISFVYVVFNNNALGWSKIALEKRGGGYLSVDFLPIDFARLSEAYGCFGARVERASEFEPALDSAFKSNLPAVVDIVANDPSEVPPIRMN